MTFCQGRAGRAPSRVQGSYSADWEGDGIVPILCNAWCAGLALEEGVHASTLPHPARPIPPRQQSSIFRSHGGWNA